MWQTAESGWVTTTLLDAGVGLRDVWETVAGLYERVCPPFSSHIVRVWYCCADEDRERRIGSFWKKKPVWSLRIG